MTVVIRLVMDENMMKAFRNVFGVKPMRKAVVAETTRLLMNTLYPDGPPKAKKQVFKLKR